MTRARSSQRGFTLVELMVALSGGLFISLAVFALARDTGRFYQRESRLANATLGAINGFQRLRDDIARAGFMSSPNATRDPFNCTPPDGAWPVGMRGLASLRIAQNVLTGNAVLSGANRQLDQITLTGSYASSDQFAIRQIINNGASFTILLNPASAAMNRIGYAGSPTTGTLQKVFLSGRALRIVDTDGRQYFGNITGVNGGPNPTITLGAAPALTFRQNSGRAGCGLKAYGTGALANVINIVQYEVLDLSANASYAALFDASRGKTIQGTTVVAPGEATRTELSRVELNTAGAPLEETRELVAEYAVDLQFAVSAVTSPAGNPDPVVSFIPPNATSFATFTSDPSVNPATTPELVRSVRVRFGVRSREADRETDIGTPTANAGLYRINLGSSGQFARVRTFQTDIMLPNQARVLW